MPSDRVALKSAEQNAAAPVGRVRIELPGLLLLAIALVFNAILLAPEIAIERMPVNDLVFHLAASERMEQALARAEPFIDPWVSEWSLGFPLWRSYQPLPHLAGAAVIRLLRPFADPDRAFAIFYYFLILLLPVSVYVGARLFELTPSAAGFCSMLVFATAAQGEFSRYGIGYGALVWRGSGLYTQLFALILLTPSLALAGKAADTGKHHLAASVLLALTALSHIIFGYAAFASLWIWSLTGPRAGRSRRLARTVSISATALVLLAWFVVPMFLVRHEINRCRWDDVFKFDSFGAPIILAELFSGRLFDSGRLPVFSLILAAASIAALANLREALPRRLLALAMFWLVLYFGRETWGHLLIALGIPSQFPLHRFQAAFELAAVLLAGWGLDRIIRRAIRSQSSAALLAGAALGVGFLVMAGERAGFLQENAVMGRANLKACLDEKAPIDAALNDVQRILAERPGRTFAGPAAGWGNRFRAGSTMMYDFLTRRHMDQASFLFHTISRTSDVMPLKGDGAADDQLFGIRAAIAPADFKPPAHWQLRGAHDRFKVYEASHDGYFSLADVGAWYDGPSATDFDPDSRWLQSPMMQQGVVVALDHPIAGLPVIHRWGGFPPVNQALLRPRGSIVAERKVGEKYLADVATARDCYALIKITWFPDLIAMVDGEQTPILRVTPGFGAIPLSAGTHHIEVSYAPGLLKPFLFICGILLVALASSRSGVPRLVAAEERLQGWFASAERRLLTERIAVAALMALLILLSSRALLRGQLIDGHDALCYPPRLTEFSKTLLEGHQLPPVWAADLGNGHGQPLFEFAPPLIYAVAMPLWKLGLGLADALQLALLVLVAIGGVAMYRLARAYRSARLVAVTVAGAWLFAPYLALDIFVCARFAESSALALTPLALLGLHRAIEKPSPRRVAVAAVAIALIPLGHSAMALLFLPVLAALVLAEASIAARPLGVIASGASALAGGLGLSACCWLPAMLEKDFVKTDLLLNGFLNWRLHAISPHQLLWSAWGYGYSVPGPNDGISFAPGLPMLALAAIGTVIALKSSDRRMRARSMVFAAAAALAAWLSTEDSALVWSHVATLQYMQFPWRTLSVVALMLPLLALPALHRIGPRGALAVLAMLVLVNLHHTEPKGYLTFDDEYYYPDSIAEKGINTTTREEYEPRWVSVRPAYSPVKLQAHDGAMSGSALQVTPSEQVFDAAAPKDTALEALTFYYPGWTVLIDDREVAVQPCPVYGTMCFKMPSGRHTVALKLRATPARRRATMLSLVSLILLAVTYALPIGRRRPDDAAAISGKI